MLIPGIPHFITKQGLCKLLPHGGLHTWAGETDSLEAHAWSHS